MNIFCLLLIMCRSGWKLFLLELMIIKSHLLLSSESPSSKLRWTTRHSRSNIGRPS
ncbi:unnamed protein product [Spirodela intermedia]|uniref:Uncharacterized protein n=1 Tax=Spirodela intermedia TaxID=51605 RepID=A0ABN7E996_SPIIN|nr:unnamed protein product [Spirodela intermedia]